MSINQGIYYIQYKRTGEYLSQSDNNEIILVPEQQKHQWEVLPCSDSTHTVKNLQNVGKCNYLSPRGMGMETPLVARNDPFEWNIERVTGAEDKLFHVVVPSGGPIDELGHELAADKSRFQHRQPKIVLNPLNACDVNQAWIFINVDAAVSMNKLQHPASSVRAGN
ncbi:hypothetical protein BDQ17DRAFT_1413636 [Cyathus striatus]|nr:hypothetical protein BDQ17DRAFT_1413636 [Cyathus striatus]